MGWYTTYGPYSYADDSSGWDGYTARQVIPASALTYSGSRIKVTLGYWNADWAFAKCYIGHQGAGDDYDFDGNQVQLLFSGGAGATVSSGGLTSDAIAFDLDKTKNLVVSFYFSDDTKDDIPLDDGNSGWALPYISATDDAATTNATGYTNVDERRALVEEIEVERILPDDANHLQVAEAPALTITGHVLSSQGADQLQVADNVTITKFTLAVQSADQLQIAESSNLIEGLIVAPADADQLQTVGNVTITKFTLAVQDADQLQVSDNITITKFTLAVQGADQLQAADNISVNLHLTVQSADQLQVTDDIHLIYNLEIADTLEIYDTVSIAWGKTIEDTLAFVEVVTNALAILANDPLTLEDTAVSNWTGTEEVESTLTMIGSLIVGEIFNETSADTLEFVDVTTYLHEMISSIADTLGLSEVVSSQAECYPAIAEALAITGLVQVITNLHNTNAETLTLTDAVGAGWGKTIEDTLAFVDVATPTFFIMATIADSLEFTESVLHQFKINESILDTLEFATTVALRQVLTSTIEDTLDFSITIELDGELWTTWVINTNQFNMSVYSGYEFNSYSVYNDTAYGCKADGIYKLTGTTDDESAFKAGIVLPETYFDSERKKRFRRGYFGLSGGTTPAIRLETDSGSQTYTITDSKANFSRNLYGRSWTVKLQDFDSVDFVKLVPIILSR